MEILEKIDKILEARKRETIKTKAPNTIDQPNMTFTIPKGTEIEVTKITQSDGSIVLDVRSLKTNIQAKLIFDNKKEMDDEGWNI